VFLELERREIRNDPALTILHSVNDFNVRHQPRNNNNNNNERS